MAESHKEENEEEALGDFIERYDMQVPEYQRACYSIKNPLC